MMQDVIYVFKVKGVETENIEWVKDTIKKYGLKKIKVERRELATHAYIVSKLTFTNSIKEMAIDLDAEIDGESRNYLKGFSDSKFKKHIIKYFEDNYPQPTFYLEGGWEDISSIEFYNRFVKGTSE